MKDARLFQFLVVALLLLILATQLLLWRRLGETTRRLKALEYSVGQAADGPDPVDKILEGALALPR